MLEDDRDMDLSVGCANVLPQLPGKKVVMRNEVLFACGKGTPPPHYRDLIAQSPLRLPRPPLEENSVLRKLLLGGCKSSSCGGWDTNTSLKGG